MDKEISVNWHTMLHAYFIKSIACIRQRQVGLCVLHPPSTPTDSNAPSPPNSTPSSDVTCRVFPGMQRGWCGREDGGGRSGWCRDSERRGGCAAQNTATEGGHLVRFHPALSPHSPPAAGGLGWGCHRPEALLFRVRNRPCWQLALS